MDEDPDFDYEMEPQVAYAALPASAEEDMDELSSEGMAISEVGLRLESADKAGIDVDFHDTAALSKAGAQLPITAASSTQVQSEEIVDAFEPFDTSAQSVENIAAVRGVATATEADSHHEQIPFEAPHEGPSHFNGSEPSAAQASEDQRIFEQDDEQDESLLREDQHPGEDVSASRAVLAIPSEESIQLQEDGAEIVQPGGEEGGSAHDINGHAYYPSEDDDQEVAVRVTFHGQDFVIWSATDIPSFLAVAPIDDTTNPDEEPEGVVQIEAPALELAKDVLWQPLDGLFAGLRGKKALGEFLEESHELHISFPDLDLDVAEDNLYCREITLDDLLQLHHGLGIATSLHIQVSERPRFITKYNELAQHVAAILGNQLEHSSDDEEEAANSGHLLRNAQGTAAEAVYELEDLQSSAEAVATGGQDVKHAGAPQKQAGVTGDIYDSSSEPRDVTASHSGAPADGPNVAITETQAAEDDSEVHRESDQHELETQEQDGAADAAEEEEGIDELAEDVQGEGGEEGGGGAEEFVAQVMASEAENLATVAEEEEDVDEAGHQDFEQDEGQANAKEVPAEVEEGDGGRDEGEEAEEVEDDDHEDQAEYQEEEDEEYADELAGTGEEAEQTFYTTINDSSEAEEDELEEPDQGAAPSSALVQSAKHRESTYAYEAADDEQDWQDEGEEQIVEYTEEQADGIINAASPSSTISTSYNAGVQRKRGLGEDEEADEDGDSAYEQDDHEAESKRVKMD